MQNPSMVEKNEKQRTKKSTREIKVQSRTSDEAGDKIILPFPMSLHALLDDAEKNGNDDIVSFFPDGTAFTIHKATEFTESLMPHYFKTTRLSSFQRQLLIYGFKRIVQPNTKLAGYHHTFFIKGQQNLSLNITRKKQGLPRYTFEKKKDSSQGDDLPSKLKRSAAFRASIEESKGYDHHHHGKPAMLSSSNPLLSRHNLSLVAAYHQHTMTPSSIESALSVLFPKTNSLHQQRAPYLAPRAGMLNRSSYLLSPSQRSMMRSAAEMPSSLRTGLPSCSNALTESRSLLLMHANALAQRQQVHQPSSFAHPSRQPASGPSLLEERRVRRKTEEALIGMAIASARYEEEQRRQNALIKKRAESSSSRAHTDHQRFEDSPMTRTHDSRTP